MPKQDAMMAHNNLKSKFLDEGLIKGGSYDTGYATAQSQSQNYINRFNYDDKNLGIEEDQMVIDTWRSKTCVKETFREQKGPGIKVPVFSVKTRSQLP